ncbi:MAG: prepilin-type N-terminal cleavage/methylation domain-containing protein [Candidatus Woesearchaeota archaeon]
MKKKLNKKGLTILEVLVSIAIIGSIIGAAVFLVINISNYGTSAEVRSIAVNYAQEAVDIVKNVKDNEYCKFFSSDYPNGSPATSPKYYKINPEPIGMPAGNVTYSITPMSSQYWQPKFPAGSKEDLASGNLRRSVSISAIPGYTNQYNERRLTVEVRWQTKGNSTYDSYKIVTDFYKWKF